MFCAACGKRVKDGARFCDNCGAPLQAPGALAEYGPDERGGAPVRPTRGRSSVASSDPYKDQISQLKLQIRQLKLNLKQVNTGMSKTRSQYYQTAAFVPRGILDGWLRRGYKMTEDMRLLGPQQQKQRLQQEIINLEQELLGLQQAQVDWKNGRR
jgi:predicted amidophosphoribosyltransferase